MFRTSTIEEPYLEFKDRIAFRNPRQALLRTGPFDYSTIPRVVVATLVDPSLRGPFSDFWNMVTTGDAYAKYRGFANTFGSSMEVRPCDHDRTKSLSRAVAEICMELPKDAILVVCLPDKDVNENYLTMKMAALAKGKRIQFILGSTLQKQQTGFIALSVATAIYAKATGVPWRLKEPLAPGGLFLGLSFSTSAKSPDIQYGVVEVFDRFGKLIEIRAETFKRSPAERITGLYVPHDQMFQILEGLKKRLNPLSLIAHKSSPFHKDEIDAYNEIDVPSALIHIETTNPYRVYNPESPTMSVARGLLLKDAENPARGILFTTGDVQDTYIQRHRLGTPRAVEINVITNGVGMVLEQFSEQILKLTKLDWNTLALEVREPITLKYSNRAAQFARVDASVLVYDIRDLM